MLGCGQVSQIISQMPTISGDRLGWRWEAGAQAIHQGLSHWKPCLLPLRACISRKVGWRAELRFTPSHCYMKWECSRQHSYFTKTKYSYFNFSRLLFEIKNTLSSSESLSNDLHQHRAQAENRNLRLKFRLVYHFMPHLLWYQMWLCELSSLLSRK